MKRVYWLLLLLVVWCIACAVWYMFSVKGLSTELRYFNPQPRFVAIVEILLMLLIACLIGYAIGWKLREDPIQVLQESTQRLEWDNEAMIKIKNEIERELERVRKALAQSQQTFNHNLSQSNETNELLSKELAELNREWIKLKESQTSSASVAQLENELGAFRFRIKQLEFQKQELEDANLKLKNEVESHVQSASRSSLVEPMHPFVRPVELSEKDDLTVIKGIGPFIEKRLNMLGIYTFRQISEFTPEMIEHISKAIEFFPKRIVRDNWVDQAKGFL